MSIFETKCPMCKGTLWIDPATCKVVEHKSPDQPKADFNEFLKSRKQGVSWDDKFQKAKEEEKRRKEEIEQKFKKAKEEKIDNKPDETGPHSLLDWD
ncbi:hypothetical protein CHISP_1855 [Chitinispirillum alkaliphilum]|nr:hypothetical protein CHISP_1855 [Chitinispirillum alkaliphilum]